MFLEGTIWRESNIVSLQANSSYECEELSRKWTTKLLYKVLQVKDRIVGEKEKCVVKSIYKRQSVEKCQGQDTVRKNRAKRL